MKKKQKRRSTRSSADGLQSLDRQSLADLASDHLHARRWRDAIKAYKELLKRGASDGAQRGLAEAYAGRASELTQKGMLKEALAIWENHAALNPEDGMHAEHCELLLRLGRPEAITALLTGPEGAQLPRKQGDRLRAQLGAQVVAGQAGLLEALPAEEPVRAQAPAAQAALQAYCNQDESGLAAALAQIPFRSPYRDLAMLLKALQRIGDSPDDAGAQLERVDDESPFAPIKRAARLSLLPDRAFLDAASKAPDAQRQVACALRGWPESRVTLWQELLKLGTEPDARTLMRLMYRHRKPLGVDWVRRKSLRLIASRGPEGAQWLRECGAPPLSRWEREMLSAWEHELDGDPFETAQSWANCAWHIKDQLDKITLSRPPLRIALMQRRADARFRILSDLPPGGQADDFELSIAKQLEDSLIWDPCDRGTYLRLIDFYRRAGKLKDARRILDQSARHWPDDRSLLEAAMQVALDGGAFKKAATIAKKILDIDPINSDVRRRLVNAHFAHAAKQVGKSRADLARKELRDAQGWARSDESIEQLALAMSLLDVIAKDQKAIESMRGRFSQPVHGLDARMELILASAALALKPSHIEGVLGLKAAKGRGQEDLAAALARLRRFLDDRPKMGNDLISTLGRLFNKATWKVLSRGELDAACDTLLRARLHRACEAAANAALKRWPEEPIFVLHRFLGKYPNGFNFKHMPDLWALESAWNRAREAGDTRTAMRIEKVLPHGPPLGGGSMPCPPLPPFFFDDEDEDDDGDEYDDLLAGGGPSGNPLGNQAGNPMCDLIRTLGPLKALEAAGAPKHVINEVKQLERALGKNGMEALVEAIFNELGIDESTIEEMPAPTPPKPKPTSPSRGKGLSKKKTHESDGQAGDGSTDESPSQKGAPKQLDLF